MDLENTARKGESPPLHRPLKGAGALDAPRLQLKDSPMLFASLPDSVSIYEVSPRDGLQNERATVPLRSKVRLIEALAAAGLKRIEVTSFVSPKWIPQLADADELAETLEEHHKHPGVVYSALCPNPKGLERAKHAKIEEIAVFISASETHNQKNVHKSVAQTLSAFEETVRPAR
jgi:hydroxymethylglutaryl-CoA lyase